MHPFFIFSFSAWWVRFLPAGYQVYPIASSPIKLAQFYSGQADCSQEVDDWLSSFRIQ